jgi:hypothetical protein
MSYEIFIYLLQEKKGLKEGSGNIITENESTESFDEIKVFLMP